MIRKIFAVFAAAAVTLCMAGCSDYVMTEEDLAIYKSIQGFWAADNGTGYNEFSDDGTLTAVTVIEFTDDFNYLMHICYPGQGYSLSYSPVTYSFEDKLFKVERDGVASYARVSVSDDGQTMYWYTDEKTDTYHRLEKETAAELGIPEYSAESWNSSETVSETGETAADGDTDT